MTIKNISFNAIYRGLFGVLFVTAIIFAVTSDFGDYLAVYAGNNQVIFLFVAFCALMLTQIAAPLSGMPIYLVIVRASGLEIAFSVLAASFLISSITNFYIARIYGKPLLAKFLSKSALNRLQYISSRQTFLSVFVSRVAGYYFHDVLSYLWGLTPVRKRVYFCGSGFGTLVAVMLQYLVFQHINVSDRLHLFLFYGGLLSISALSYLAWRTVFERR